MARPPGKLAGKEQDMKDTQYELTEEQLIDELSGFHRSNFTCFEAQVLAIGRAAIAAHVALNASTDPEPPNGGTKLYTHPATDVLAALRAKVEALATSEDGGTYEKSPEDFRREVLAEIDKLGGKV